MRYKSRMLVWFWIVCWLAAGCGPLFLSGGATKNRPPEYPYFSPTPVTLLGRYTTPRASSTLPPPPTATVTVDPCKDTNSCALKVTATQPSLPTPTASPVSPSASATPDAAMAFHICTPLADILLEDLPRLISDGYHPPPRYYSDARHPGIDIAYYNWKGQRQIAGVPVQSVLPGRVAVVETDTFPFGNVVIVETEAWRIPIDVKDRLGIAEDRSLYLLYAHMKEDSLRVALGQKVTACQTIGQVGKTGNTQAAHLHLENRIGPPGIQFVGFAAYSYFASEQEKKNYRQWATSGEFRHFDPLRLLLYEFGYVPTPYVKEHK